MTPDEDVAERLRQSVGRFVRVVRSQTGTMPASHAAALGALDRAGPQTIALLAARRGVKHQSMSRTVAELDALGLIARASDPGDGRAFVITLTEAGARALESDRGSRRQWVAEAIAARLTAAERELLHAVPDLLDRLSAAEQIDAS